MTQEQKTNTSPKNQALLVTSLALALAAVSGPGIGQTGTSATSSSSSSEEKTDASTRINKAVRLLAQMEKDQTLEGALSRAKGVFVVPDYGRAVPGSSGKGSTSSSPSSNHRDASHK